MAIYNTFAAANRRAKDLQSSVPRALAAHYDRANGRVVIRLNTGLDVSFSPRDAKGLEHARSSQLEPNRN